MRSMRGAIRRKGGPVARREIRMNPTARGGDEWYAGGQYPSIDTITIGQRREGNRVA
jgi:hypothetical protein